MCEFYCIVFIEYIIAGKTLLDYTNLFSLNDYQKNDKVTYKYFKDKCDKRKYGRRLQIKKIDETRNYFSEEIQQIDLMGEKHKEVCMAIN